MMKIGIRHFILFSMVLLLCCCDGMKWDENGDLDGMWQMTEWRDNHTGNIVKTNKDGYYYCFQLKLLKFQEKDKGSHYLSHFKRTGNSLLVEAPVFYPDEEKRPMEELAKYGIPSNGRLTIDLLNSERLQLSTEDAVMLFRKY